MQVFTIRKFPKKNSMCTAVIRPEFKFPAKMALSRILAIKGDLTNKNDSF